MPFRGLNKAFFCCLFKNMMNPSEPQQPDIGMRFLHRSHDHPSYSRLELDRPRPAVARMLLDAYCSRKLPLISRTNVQLLKCMHMGHLSPRLGSR